jgi:DNA gyrase subunit A
MGMATKEEDYIEQVVSVHSHSTVMMFTNTGKVQCIRGFMIPEASRTAKGTNVVNLRQLTEGEKITSMIAVGGFPEGEYLVMITKNGVIKRTLLSEFEYQRKGGKIAISLDEDDELLYVLHTTGDKQIIIATAAGNAVRFDENNVRCMGRTARGVRGIALREGDDGRDRVVGAVVVDDNKHLVTITERGFGKRSPFDDFRTMANRGGFGVRCQNITEKTGLLAGIAAVDGEEDLMMITDQGTIIRTPASDLSILSRSAGGVIVMRLPGDQYVANFTIVAKEEKEDDEIDTEDIEGTDTTENTEIEDTQPVEITDEELL